MNRGVLRKDIEKKIELPFTQSLNKIYEPEIFSGKKHCCQHWMLELLSATASFSALLPDNLNNFPWEDIF